MVFTTIIYDDSAGSDTAASGSNAPSTAVTGTNGDIATSTITLNGTFDLTGASATDAVWYEGNAGDRHLFTIQSFTGGVGSCTAIVVDQTATASRSAKKWAVGGKRKTLDNDTSRPDFEDCQAGWRYELEANGTSPHYSIAAASTAISMPNVGDSSRGAPEIVAASGDSPVVEWLDTAAACLSVAAGGWLYIEGISFTNTTGSAATNRLVSAGSSCIVKLVGVTHVAAGGAIYASSGNNGHFRAVGCDIKATAENGIHSGAGNHRFLVQNSTLHNCLHYGVGFVTSTAGGTCVVRSSIIRDNGLGGIYIDQNDSSQTVDISNNVFHGNTGDGISFTNTASADAGPYVVINNIFTSNSAYGIDAASGFHLHQVFLDNNAYRSNTSGEVNGFTRTSRVGEGANDVTLTADPYTNAAGDDYTLNATAGGGAACKDAGYGYNG